MKNVLVKAVLTVAFLMLPAMAVKGAETVNVAISPFEQNIVYTDFYNYAVEYPVLLHNEILYIPLTSSMCNELYLSIAFTPEDGLYVARGGGRGLIGQERQQALGAIEYRNPADGRVSAVVPEYPVYINGRRYDNATAEYQFLNFRGITYLPLIYDIIHNEFDFDFKFDGKRLTLAGNSWYGAPYVTESNEEYIEFAEHKSVYSESLNEYGDIHYSLQYSYDEYHRLNLSDDSVVRMPDNYVPTQKDTSYSYETDERIRISDKKIYFEGTEIPDITKDGNDTASAVAEDFDGTTFLIFGTYKSGFYGPYSAPRKYHIFVKDECGITELPWDDINNYAGIIYNGNGIWYLYTQGSSRYGNHFSDIYRYTKENGLERLSDKYHNLNSLEPIGIKDGKLYVFGALRDGDRTRPTTGESLNPMHSGYYTIDENLVLTKISPYMGARADATLAENGNLYVLTNYSSNNRLINLNTGEIIAEL